MAYPRLRARFFIAPGGGAIERARGGVGARLRETIWRRDGARCQVCGRPVVPYQPHFMASEVMGEVDHILPASRGGSHEETNLRLVCASLNRSRKADVADEQARCRR